MGTNSGSRTDRRFRDSPHARFTGCSRGVGATVQPKGQKRLTVTLSHVHPQAFLSRPHCSLGVVILQGEDHTRLGGGCSSGKGLLASGRPEQGGERTRDPVRERD